MTINTINTNELDLLHDGERAEALVLNRPIIQLIAKINTELSELETVLNGQNGLVRTVNGLKESSGILIPDNPEQLVQDIDVLNSIFDQVIDSLDGVPGLAGIRSTIQGLETTMGEVQTSISTNTGMDTVIEKTRSVKESLVTVHDEVFNAGLTDILAEVEELQSGVDSLLETMLESSGLSGMHTAIETLREDINNLTNIFENPGSEALAPLAKALESSVIPLTLALG